jgi:hypothetical protein
MCSKSTTTESDVLGDYWTISNGAVMNRNEGI